MEQSNIKEWNELFLGASNPFLNTIVRNAWEDSVTKFDVKSINSEATDLVLQLLIGVKQNSFSTACLIQGQPGVGKSHFLGRLRYLSESNNYLFVSVRPISDMTNIFNHIYKEIFLSLRKKNPADTFAPIDLLISSILTETLIIALKEKDRVNALNPKILELIDAMEKDSTLILRILEIDQNALEIFYSVSEKAIGLVEKNFPEVNIDFLTVLFKYLNPDLQNYALRWLQGDNVSEEYLNQLGVNGAIDNEETAHSILHSVMTLSPRPILLCFDQFESIYDRFKDLDLLTAFFDTLVRICNETPNTVILLMVQSSVWTGSIEPNIQDSALQRIEYRGSLKTPTLDELVELVALRLKPIYLIHPYPPENKIYPFTINLLENIALDHGWNPRSVLKVLSELFQKVKLEQALDVILNPATSSTPIVIDEIKTQTKEEFIEEQFKTIISNYSDDPVENPFSNRENNLEAGMYDIFNSLKLSKETTILNVKIKDTSYKKKVKDLDMVLKVENKSKIESWGIEICYAENYSTIGKILKKIQENLNNQIISRWILLRDIHLPIKPTWKKTNELLNNIITKGKVLYIDQNNSSKIVAYKEILDIISAGDLQFANRPLNRNDINEYFFKEIVPKIPLIFQMFSQVEILDNLPKEIKEFQQEERSIKIGIQLLREKLMGVAEKNIIVNVNKDIDNYLERKEEYNEIIDDLANEKKIVILSNNQRQGQILFIKKLEGSVF